MPRPKTFQLDRAFNAAYKSVKANRDALNALDGANGNHGDNAANNLKIISQAVKAAKGQAPSTQLAQAAEQLAVKGQGGTAQHYANGLREAARKFEGQERLGKNDVPALLQTLMGNVPAQGYQPAQPKPQASSSNQNDIGDLLGALGGQGAVQPSAGAQAGGTAPSAGAGGGASVLSALLGMAAGGSAPATSTPADPLSALLGAAAGNQGAGAGQDPFAALLGGAGGGSNTGAAADPFAALLGGAAGGGQSGSAAQDPFAALLGAAGGQSGAPVQQDPLGGLLSSLIPDKPGLDLADVIQAGTAYMGAQAQGADTAGAALQAVMAALRGVKPLNASSARTASGGLVAQSILDSVFGKP